MRIGIIYTSYGIPEYLGASINPWLNAKRDRLDGHEFIVCAVSLPFKDFDFVNDQDTPANLRHYFDIGAINSIITKPEFIPETEARGGALKYLLSCNVDLIWQADGDELPTLVQISSIIRFVETNPFVSWFRLSLKNYVFDNKTYLVNPFTPARIHRVGSGLWRAKFFIEDNNICYEHIGGTHISDRLPEIKRDISFSSLIIPSSIAFISHLSWLNDNRSKLKCAYQTRRWGSCSFAWDERTNQLVFNKEFYLKSGQPIPEIAHENG